MRRAPTLARFDLHHDAAVSRSFIGIQGRQVALVHPLEEPSIDRASHERVHHRIADPWIEGSAVPFEDGRSPGEPVPQQAVDEVLVLERSIDEQSRDRQGNKRS